MAKRGGSSFFQPREDKKAKPESRGPTMTQEVQTCPICLQFKSAVIAMMAHHVEGCLSKPLSATSSSFTPSSSSKSSSSFSSSSSSSKSSSSSSHSSEQPQQPALQCAIESGGLPGLYLLKDFITKDEERLLLSSLDAHPSKWEHSWFNGHCLTKHFGVHTEFYGKDRHVRSIDPGSNADEHSIPPFTSFLFDRLKLLPALVAHADPKLCAELAKFVPNEFNANAYQKALNHYLTKHVDDRQLSGPLLANLSMGAESTMRYTLEKDPGQVLDVVLPPRTLQIVGGDARWNWTHEIPNDLLGAGRRVSITIRQAGSKSGVPLRAPLARK